MDYAYTINGWLKGMNSSFIDPSKDMGRDGIYGYNSTTPGLHNWYAKDVLAYTIGYFDNDYKQIGTTNFEATYKNTLFNANARNLYNGNIKSYVSSIVNMNTLGSVYSYNQLNNLVGVQSYYSANNLDWSNATHSQDYESSYEYDKNGNLLKLKRNAFGNQLAMDDFEYNYVGLDNQPLANSTAKSNRLDFVTDHIGATQTTNYQDIKDSQLAGNYQYDELGQLIKDVDEGIDLITWRTGDKKIASMQRTQGSNESELAFVYNPFGQRVIKIEKPKLNGAVLAEDNWKYTYYSYDANGQVMAVYSIARGPNVRKAKLDEQYIYGAERIGLINQDKILINYVNKNPNSSSLAIETAFLEMHLNQLAEENTKLSAEVDGGKLVGNNLGNKHYEITNYLSNVNVVITDRKVVSQSVNSSGGTYYEAVIVQTADYYPYGMLMPGRQYNAGSYRYTYTGMETDNEVSGAGNSFTTEFRQYDPRLGRWKSLDPLMMMFPQQSPYCAFDNNPVFFIDPYGLEAEGNGKDKVKDKNDDIFYGDAEKNAKSWIKTNTRKGNILRGATYEVDELTGDVKVTYFKVVKMTVTLSDEKEGYTETIYIKKSKTFLQCPYCSKDRRVLWYETGSRWMRKWDYNNKKLQEKIDEKNSTAIKTDSPALGLKPVKGPDPFNGVMNPEISSNSWGKDLIKKDSKYGLEVYDWTETFYSEKGKFVVYHRVISGFDSKGKFIHVTAEVVQDNLGKYVYTYYDDGKNEIIKGEKPIEVYFKGKLSKGKKRKI